jgi:hypothetical protein
LLQQSATGFDRSLGMFRVGASVLARLVSPRLVAEVLAEAGQQQVADAVDVAVASAQGQGRLVAELAAEQAAARAVVRSRVRGTSPLLGVYLVLAGTLFPTVSVAGVFEKLTGVVGRPAGVPSAVALNARRASLSARVFQVLFARLRGAGPAVGAAWFAGLLVCAWDGTTLMAPDTPSNRSGLGSKSNQAGPGGFPLVRLLVLVACGSRALIDAAVGPVRVGEDTMARHLVGSLRPGMLLLADRLFPGFRLWCRCVDSGAELLWRLSSSIRLTVEAGLPDGSAIGWWYAPSTVSKKRRGVEHLPDRVRVRIITGRITVTDAGGVRRSHAYRLVTTLLDDERHPAAGLLELYARRWQVELMIKGLKCVQHASGATLRSRTHPMVIAEAWAYLCTHQLLRLEAAAAARTADADTAQISFTALVERFRNAVIRTGGRRGAATELARLRAATATDTIGLDLHIRRYDRVRKRPVSKYTGKKPSHGGGVITVEYNIDTHQTPPP